MVEHFFKIAREQTAKQNCRSRTVPFSFLHYFFRFGCSATALVYFDSVTRETAMAWLAFTPSQTRCPCAADRSPCVIATIGGETVTTDCSPSAEADDICKSLECAVLKYFPALAWRRSVSTNCSQSAEAEDICTSLERAVLKFFAGPIENVDTFLFAEGDDSAVGDLQTACLPRPPTATDFQLTLFSAES